MIQESGKNLKSVYISHHHPDHYFGLSEIVKAFPEAKIFAQPTTVEHQEDLEGKGRTMGSGLWGQYPDRTIIPRPISGLALELEGEIFPVYMNAQGDDHGNSYVWIPSLKAVICGDIVYNGAYPWTAETTSSERKEWIRSVEKIESLKPSIAVAGPGSDEDGRPFLPQVHERIPSFYDAAVITSRNIEELRSAVKNRFPGFGDHPEHLERGHFPIKMRNSAPSVGTAIKLPRTRHRLR